MISFRLVTTSIATIECAMIMLSCSANNSLPTTSSVSVDRKPDNSSATWLDYIQHRMPAEERTIMPYENKYRGDPDLAGIECYQHPLVDNTVEDYSVYDGKHPGAVVYHFWDGRILSLYYSPDGRVMHKNWFKHESDPAKLKAKREYAFSWEMVDFSKGSDPHFEHHTDPRNPPGHGLYP